MLFLKSHGARAGVAFIVVSLVLMAMTTDRAVALSLSLVHPRRVLPFAELIGVHTGTVLPALVVPGLASWERPHMRVELRFRCAMLCVLAIAIPAGSVALVGAISGDIPALGKFAEYIWMLTALTAVLVPIIGPLIGPPISVVTYWALVMGDQISPRWSAFFPLASSTASSGVALGWALSLSCLALATWLATGGQSRVARQFARHGRGR